MKQEIQELLENYFKAEDVEFDFSTVGSDPNELYDLLICELDPKRVHQEEIDSRRWWSDTFEVVEIMGKLVGYNGATTTGDDTPIEKGWEFDPNSLYFVEKVTEMVEVTSYK